MPLHANVGQVPALSCQYSLHTCPDLPVVAAYMLLLANRQEAYLPRYTPAPTCQYWICTGPGLFTSATYLPLLVNSCYTRSWAPLISLAAPYKAIEVVMLAWLLTWGQTQLWCCLIGVKGLKTFPCVCIHIYIFPHSACIYLACWQDIWIMCPLEQACFPVLLFMSDEKALGRFNKPTITTKRALGGVCCLINRAHWFTVSQGSN